MEFVNDGDPPMVRFHSVGVLSAVRVTLDTVARRRAIDLNLDPIGVIRRHLARLEDTLARQRRLERTLTRMLGTPED